MEAAKEGPRRGRGVGRRAIGLLHLRYTLALDISGEGDQLQLEDRVEKVPGVGARRAEELRTAGVLTVEDLLLHLPIRYEDRSAVLPIRELRSGEAACVRATVHSVRRAGPPGRRRGRAEATVADDSGSLRVVWFNQPWVADSLARGDEVLLYGKPSAYRGQLQIANPVHDRDGDDSLHVGRPVPVYRRVGSLGPAMLRRLVAAALDGVAEVEEELPARVVRERGLLARGEALRALHYPESGDDLELWNASRSEAHRRVVLQEFVDFQTALLLQRRLAARESGRAHALGAGEVERALASLPFTLTGAQQRCLRELLEDVRASRAMHRLLQGDVGSGKTAVAGAALMALALAGEQGVLLAPTEILARQHAATLAGWGEAAGVTVWSLTGGGDRSARQRVLEELEAGRAGIVVGTHALLEPDVEVPRLSLVAIDEQHRFGVRQRAALRAKGRREGAQPDLLVMTATPIPRSLALTLYGDLDVSVVDELPPGRAPVDTATVAADEWDAVADEIRATASRGEQVFVVSPRIEEGDDDLRAATVVAEELAGRLAGVEVALVHGGLPRDDREGRMARFVAGQVPVLVATTVVEVGVDVPAATLMVIEHAERFGLAQLHQLRGRVGRGGRRGRCLLVAHPPLTETARTRLTTVCATTDGFRIAEEDLRLRGAGEFLGTRQTGAFELRVGDPFEHPDWLAEAHAIARDLATAEDAEARSYRDALRTAWRRRMRLARAG